MTDANGVNERFAWLRDGYAPTEAEASAWNVAGTIDAMRHPVTGEDAAWLLPAIAGNDGPRAALYLALLQPLAARPDVRCLPVFPCRRIWRAQDIPERQGSGLRPTKDGHAALLGWQQMRSPLHTGHRFTP